MDALAGLTVDLAFMTAAGFLRRDPEHGLSLCAMGGFSRADLAASLSDNVRASMVRLDPDIFEDAFPFSDAGAVVDELAEAGVVVLGGDFYNRDGDGRFRPTHSNWHYEDGDATESVQRARLALAETWVSPDWWVTFVWRDE